MASSEYDYGFKVVIVGDSGVGKSCLQLRFTDNTFTDRFTSTIGVEFKTKILEIDNKKVNLILWDTAGQERFRAITTSFYRGAHGIILVYDVTKQQTFDNIQKWLETINKLTSSDTSMLLVGNKSDLISDREVDPDKAKAFAAESGIPLVETSAKDSTNVDKVFVTIAAMMKNKPNSYDQNQNKTKVKLDPKKESKTLCC